MDTDHSRDLARLGRMAQELALLRKVEQAAGRFRHLMHDHLTSDTEWDASMELEITLATLDAWRDEHAKVTP